MYYNTNNIPYYRNNMQYNRSYYPYPVRYQNGRFIPGGFLVPFGLGLLTAPLIFRPNYYPYPYYKYPMYY